MSLPQDVDNTISLPVNYTNYDSYYEDNIDFSQEKTDIKVVTYYLAQFHEFKENNEWWGKGFTEWTNTRKARPLFKGHYQPREPHDDIGYYNLTDVNAIKKQVKLAKEHGIYGFAIYYYWFSGTILMDKPLDIIYNNKDIDIHYSLLWSNEDWTRSWDGLNGNILIKHDYNDADDIAFIKQISKYLQDERYIKIDNKPVIQIYKPYNVPDMEATITRWRDWCRDNGIGEIYMLATSTAGHLEGHVPPYFDGLTYFPYHRDLSIVHNKAEHHNYDYSVFFNNDTVRYSNFDYSIFYSKESIARKKSSYMGINQDVFPTITLGWDNTARRGDKAVIFHNYSNQHFYYNVRRHLALTQQKNHKSKQFLFINAWNEWAEGAYLEPDQKYGYTSINTLSRAIFDKHIYEYKDTTLDYSNTVHYDLTYRPQGKIGVHLHVSDTKSLSVIGQMLKHIPYPFDLIFTYDQKLNTDFKSIPTKLKIAKVNEYKLISVENRGRDMAPFLITAREYLKDYTYICHLNTDQNLDNKFNLYKHILGSETIVSHIIQKLDDEDTGIIKPLESDAIFEKFYPKVSLQNLQYYPFLQKSNYFKAPDLDSFSAITLAKNLALDEHNIMYTDTSLLLNNSIAWFHKDALQPLFNLNLTLDNFEHEDNQTDGTLSYILTSSFSIIAQKQGLKVYSVKGHMEVITR